MPDILVLKEYKEFNFFFLPSDFLKIKQDKDLLRYLPLWKLEKCLIKWMELLKKFV